jgi:hypothetical protein
MTTARIRRTNCQDQSTRLVALAFRSRLINMISVHPHQVQACTLAIEDVPIQRIDSAGVELDFLFGGLCVLPESTQESIFPINV